MKKRAILFAVTIAAFAFRSQGDQVTLSLEAGQLLTAGDVAIPNGSLIQLLGDTSSTFGAPTSSSFTGTDPNEVLLASFAMNSSTTGIPGDFLKTLGPFNLTGTGTPPDAGSFLLLRWYPSLTTSSSAPGSGTSYGQFSTNAVENGSDIAWVMPASGTKALNFLTASQGGSESNSAGVANLTIAAVPEVATPPIFAGVFGLLALVWLKTRRQPQ